MSQPNFTTKDITTRQRCTLGAKGHSRGGGYHPCRQKDRQQSLPRRVAFELEDKWVWWAQGQKGHSSPWEACEHKWGGEGMEGKTEFFGETNMLGMKDIFEWEKKRTKKERFANESHLCPAEDCIFYFNSVWILFSYLMFDFHSVWEEEIELYCN